MGDGDVRGAARSFQTRVHHLPGVDYAVVAGELDMHSVWHLRSELTRADCDQETLLLDLERLTFMDSTGIAVLVSAHRDAEARSARLVIACDNDRTLRTIKMVGLRDVFEIHPSAAAYLAERGLAVPDDVLG